MLNLSRYLKIILFTGLACISNLADADSNKNHQAPPTLTGVDKFKYKIGDEGPGGGFIFFVDYYDQYPNFTYLEAAPNDASVNNFWCNNVNTSFPEVTGWAANAVGRGHANTVAMLAECSSGAAWSAHDYSTNSTAPGDWFLPSLGEQMLMYTNLRLAGVGNFNYVFYWSSTEWLDQFNAWSQDFRQGGQEGYSKGGYLPVRAIRSF